MAESSFFEVVTVKVYWNSGGGKPFADTVEPLNHDVKMIDLITDIVERCRPNEDIDFDKDIKSITTLPSW